MHLLVRWTTVIPSFLEYPKTLQRMLQLVLCSWWGNQIAYHYYDQTQYCCHINWQQTRFITRCVWQIDSVKLVVPVTCRSSRISSSGYTALTLYHLLLQWHRYFLRSRRSLNYYCFSHLFFQLLLIYFCNLPIISVPCSCNCYFNWNCETDLFLLNNNKSNNNNNNIFTKLSIQLKQHKRVRDRIGFVGDSKVSASVSMTPASIVLDSWLPCRQNGEVSATVTVRQIRNNAQCMQKCAKQISNVQ